MAFSNSPLVTQTKLVPNHYNPRNRAIAGITIHHNAGVATVSQLLNYAYNTTRQMSFNYCVNDNEIGMLVEEKNRAWTSSNAANDHRCVTIEVCNSSAGGDWPISDKSMATLIKLCADICKRNGISKLYYDGTTNGTLTRHEMFAATPCPGPYIKEHTQYICDEVNKLISGGSGETDPVPSNPETYAVVVSLKGYYTAANAISGTDPRVTVNPGTYYIYNQTSGAVNVTKTKGAPGAWINKSLNVNPGTKPDPDPVEFKVGDSVKVKSGAKSYEGKKISSFVYEGLYKIDELVKDRAVLDKKGICTAFNVKDLYFPEGSKPVDPDPQPTDSIKVGDIVKVKAGAKSYEGKSISESVYSKTHTVDELVRDRAVLGLNGGICTAFNVKDLTKVSEGSTSSAIKKGDRVKILESAKKWSTGEGIPSWVYSKVLYVRNEPSKTCQVSIYETGAITGVISVDSLVKA